MSIQQRGLSCALLALLWTTLAIGATPDGRALSSAKNADAELRVLDYGEIVVRDYLLREIRAQYETRQQRVTTALSSIMTAMVMQMNASRYCCSAIAAAVSSPNSSPKAV